MVEPRVCDLMRLLISLSLLPTYVMPFTKQGQD